MKTKLSLSIIKACSNTKRAFSLIEVVLATFIFVFLAAFLVVNMVYGQESTILAGNRARAVFLAEEGLEAVRNIRDADFNNLNDGVHGLAISGGLWILSGSADLKDIFSRQITISTIDAQTKNIVAEISWQQNPQRSGLISLNTRLTNWSEEISLGNNWSNPLLSASLDLNGNDDGLKVQIQGNYAYVVRNSGNPRLAIIDISDPLNPTLTGSLMLVPGQPLNVFVLGNTAYIVGSQNNTELQIVDISNPATPNVVGTYNAPGNASALGIYVVGNTAYMTRENSRQAEFYILDVTNPASVSVIGNLNLNLSVNPIDNQNNQNIIGNLNEIIISNNYAFVASSASDQELQVIDISNPASPFLAGGLDLPGSNEALTLALVNDKLLLGQGNNFRIVDITNPLSPQLISSIWLGGIIRDIALNLANTNNYAFVATDNPTSQFQVIDISNTSSPVLLSSLIAPDTLNGIAYDPSLDLVIAVGNDNNQEVIIITPQ